MRTTATFAAAFCTALVSTNAWPLEPPGVLKMTLGCIDHKVAEANLKGQKEKLKTMAVTKDDSAVMEIWTDGKGGQWTLVLHRTIPTNVRCMVMSGNGIIEVKQLIEKGLVN